MINDMVKFPKEYWEVRLLLVCYEGMFLRCVRINNDIKYPIETNSRQLRPSWGWSIGLFGRAWFDKVMIIFLLKKVPKEKINVKV